jgi:hypothetical protein
MRRSDQPQTPEDLVEVDLLGQRRSGYRDATSELDL